ncbi:MAG TPA: endonuclease/exonuclease/phosphatase family protein [Streptosporangiaceae bacterium]|nr:endonuclease/exonuclease/phosphatase family protein [Streptosporangiaceae bacterium]
MTEELSRARENQASLVTLASLNLHGGVTGRGAPFDVAEACHRLKADVITLQEAWRPETQPDAVTGAAAALGAEVRHRGLARNTSRARLAIGTDEASGTWGLAVLTMLPVIGYREIELGRAPGDRIGRAAQVLTLATPAGGALRVVNTHLTHRYSSPVQLALLVRRLATGSPVPTVIVGDLNMPRPATVVARGYRPVVRGRTFPADRPLIQLDHMLLRGSVAALGAEVAEPLGSDHLPIRAQLSLT